MIARVYKSEQVLFPHLSPVFVPLGVFPQFDADFCVQPKKRLSLRRPICCSQRRHPWLDAVFLLRCYISHDIIPHDPKKLL